MDVVEYNTCMRAAVRACGPRATKRARGGRRRPATCGGAARYDARQVARTRRIVTYDPQRERKQSGNRHRASSLPG